MRKPTEKVNPGATTPTQAGPTRMRGYTARAATPPPS